MLSQHAYCILSVARSSHHPAHTPMCSTHSSPVHSPLRYVNPPTTSLLPGEHLSRCAQQLVERDAAKPPFISRRVSACRSPPTALIGCHARVMGVMVRWQQPAHGIRVSVHAPLWLEFTRSRPPSFPDPGSHQRVLVAAPGAGGSHPDPSPPSCTSDSDCSLILPNPLSHPHPARSQTLPPPCTMSPGHRCPPDLIIRRGLALATARDCARPMGHHLARK
ncbi:hypothetical protein LXA43DRAFT_153376 [Ganoderma leucocontextum]|nr:hypothetical protein LXA43DRAFT_153376 [Ganoderma leucocontextum]